MENSTSNSNSNSNSNNSSVKMMGGRRRPRRRQRGGQMNSTRSMPMKGGQMNSTRSMPMKGGQVNSTRSMPMLGGASSAVGSHAAVWHGTARKTSGGLTKRDLMKNKHGRIVSRKKHALGKKALKNLVKAGYKAKKGTFKLFRK